VTIAWLGERDAHETSVLHDDQLVEVDGGTGRIRIIDA
jgi:hypothetical protein